MLSVPMSPSNGPQSLTKKKGDRNLNSSISIRSNKKAMQGGENSQSKTERLQSSMGKYPQTPADKKTSVVKD